MNKKNKTLLLGLLPFGILIFFMMAAYEARTIYKSAINPEVINSLNKNAYYQKHLKCLSFAEALQKSNLSILKKDSIKTTDTVNEIKECQKHSVAWATLSEADKKFLIEYTNAEPQNQYLRQIYFAANDLLTKNYDRESSSYQSALVILKMEIPKTHLKKGVGPLSLMFLFSLFIMFILFRKNPDAQKIKNDGRIFGISYRGLNPFKRTKEGK
ncbi:hypothetical protein [Bdellovibrio sp. BCCA]|uniref:hypothetical protein n=1 Tax=Bdellovibrio sp. BCCA TaxID=3136281 RepID=UPI0030F07E67